MARRRREKDTEARTNFLTTGWELLTKGEAPLQPDELRLVDLLQAAGHSNGAFYHLWPGGMTDYQASLLEYALAADRAPYMVQLASELAEADVTLEHLARDFGSRDAAYLDGDKSWRVAISVWARHFEDDETTKTLRDGYREFTDDIYTPMYQGIMEKYGLAFRAPFNARLFAVTALAEGLGLRRAVDPDSVALPVDHSSEGWELFGLVSYLITAVTTRPAGDDDGRSALEFARDLLAVSEAETNASFE
jgi:hypothetical protein